MTKQRLGGWALSVGSIAGMLAMSQHPTAEDLFAPGQLAPMSRMLILVHALALVSLPVLFLGALALWQRLGSDDGLSVAGLVLYAFAMVAVMNAAGFDGLGTPTPAPHVPAPPPAASQGWPIAFPHNGQGDPTVPPALPLAGAAAPLPG